MVSRRFGNLWKTSLVVVMTLATTGSPEAANPCTADDAAAIRATMQAYQNALNASDTSAVLPLYTEDGVFMPPYSPSAVGKGAVRQAYDNVFRHITLHVQFRIEELVQMAPDWAFVRTNSAGTNTDNATKAQSAEGNQELFILHKDQDGKWRIARYGFSSTNPAPQR